MSPATLPGNNTLVPPALSSHLARFFYITLIVLHSWLYFAGYLMFTAYSLLGMEVLIGGAQKEFSEAMIGHHPAICSGAAALAISVPGVP